MNLDHLKSIRLDIGCGENKQSGFVGMDKRILPGIDIVHDLEAFPWPLEDECCSVIVASHILEHIKPWLTLDIFNEMWRVMQVGGQLAIALPYAGSPGYWQDPTHCNGFNEATWQYFDPAYSLWGIYKPKPWQIQKGFPVWQCTGQMEVMMVKMAEVKKKEAPPLGIHMVEQIGAGEALGG